MLKNSAFETVPPSKVFLQNDGMLLKVVTGDSEESLLTESECDVLEPAEDTTAVRLGVLLTG